MDSNPDALQATFDYISTEKIKLDLTSVHNHQQKPTSISVMKISQLGKNRKSLPDIRPGQIPGFSELYASANNTHANTKKSKFWNSINIKILVTNYINKLKFCDNLIEKSRKDLNCLRVATSAIFIVNLHLSLQLWIRGIIC